MPTPAFRPSGHHDITAYLAVPSVRRMIDFYVAAFDAVELFVVQAAENVAYHAEIRIGDTVLALHEDLPGIARARPPARLGGTSATFTIWTPDVDAAFDRAIAAGASVDSPPENSYWGDRIARVTDPAGHGWSLAAHLHDVPVEEQRRQARAHHADHATTATATRADAAGKWDARYRQRTPAFVADPLVDVALELGLPPGGVLELACGPSGSALALAEKGLDVTCVDVSSVALGQLRAEARRRDLDRLIILVHADLDRWHPEGRRFALVLCTYFWDRAVFRRAAATVAPAGLLAWQTFTASARGHGAADWKLRPGEPAALLPPGFAVLVDEPVAQPRTDTHVRRFIARRQNAA